jgi:putative protease
VLYDCDLAATREALARAKAAGVTHVLCGNIGHLSLAKESGLTVVADFRANVCNRYSASVWQSLGAQEVLLSPELILPQMRDVGGTAIVYGRLPLMLLERRLGVGSLCDRMGARFPVLSEARVPSGVRDVVYNSVPLYMADAEKALGEAHITSRHFIFTVETPAQVRAVLDAYRTHAAPTTAVRRIAKSR